MGVLQELFRDAPGRKTSFGIFDCLLIGSDDATRMSSWVKYTGPRGGEGWRNIQTDEVRYQADMPGGGDAESGITFTAPIGSYGTTGIVRDGKTVGHIEYSLETPTGLMIQYIRVNPSERKQGVAVEALRAFGEQARRAGRTEIYGKLTSKAAAKAMEKAFGKPLRVDADAFDKLPDQPPEDSHGGMFDPLFADAVYPTVAFSSRAERVEAWARLQFEDAKKAKRFAEWFGDSIAVDANGNPRKVFHGTNREFDSFHDGKPLFFAEDRSDAEHYAAINARYGGAPRIIEAFLYMKRDGLARLQEIQDSVSYTSTKDAFRQLAEEGFDGFHEPGGMYVVFSPEQVEIDGDVSMEPMITMSTWVKYKGPRGGDGWRNTVTDEVRYQEEMPGDNEPQAEVLTGYDWHEKGAVREWAIRFPHQIQKAVTGYAGFGSTDINNMLRGTYKPRKTLVFVREQTPEEQEMPQYDPVFEESYKPDVDGGEEYRQRNVLYRDENGIARGWAIVKMVDNQKLIDQTNESIHQINKGISDHGIVLDRDINVYRAAYIPGLRIEDLEKLVGSPEPFEEKGFTSTFYGAEGQRLTGYVIAGKSESVYRRREQGDFSLEDSPALRIKIRLPKGTKVLSVEALRRISYDYPRTIPTEDPSFFMKDYNAEPVRVDTSDLDNPRMRSESEILIGSGARFRITSVKRAEVIDLEDKSVLKRPVQIVDVEMEYIGGGSSDASAR